MGIKISYKGSNGRSVSMDYDGSDESLDKLQEFAAAHAVKAPDRPQLPFPKRPDVFNIENNFNSDGNKRKPGGGMDEQGLVALDEHDPHPGYLKEKLSRNTSLEVSHDGLQLIGDDRQLSGDGPHFFSRNEDKPGWKSLGDIDPSSSSEHVGPAAGDLSLETNDGSMDSESGATSRTYFSRFATKLEATEDGPVLTLYGFYFTQRRSKYGRVISESAESRAIILTLNLANPLGGNSSTSNGKYGVKPVFSGGVLQRLDFGTEQQLDADNPSFSVPTSLCPNS